MWLDYKKQGEVSFHVWQYLQEYVFFLALQLQRCRKITTSGENKEQLLGVNLLRKPSTNSLAIDGIFRGKIENVLVDTDEKQKYVDQQL